MVNLLCEHALVSAFVDQQHLVSAAVVEAVARDFDMTGDSSSTNGNGVTPSKTTDFVSSGAEKFDLLEALKTLATLADRLRQSEQDAPKERKI